MVRAGPSPPCHCASACFNPCVHRTNIVNDNHGVMIQNTSKRCYRCMLFSISCTVCILASFHTPTDGPEGTTTRTTVSVAMHEIHAHTMTLLMKLKGRRHLFHSYTGD